MHVTYSVGSLSSNQVALDTGLSSYTIQFVFQSTTASSVQFSSVQLSSGWQLAYDLCAWRSPYTLQPISHWENKLYSVWTQPCVSESDVAAYMGFSKHIDHMPIVILNWAELNWTELNWTELAVVDWKTNCIVYELSPVSQNQMVPQWCLWNRLSAIIIMQLWLRIWTKRADLLRVASIFLIFCDL